MVNAFRIFWLTSLLILLASGWIFANPFHVGQHVTLHAVKAVGVPIHHTDSPSFWKHVPDRTAAIVRRINDQNHWLYLSLESGDQGWVHPKYVRVTTIPSPIQPRVRPLPENDSVPDEVAVWISRERCETILRTGRQMALASPNTMRIATWNLRWFPSGQSPERSDPATQHTDVKWVACTIAWMQVDVLAVQESLGTPEASQAWNLIIQSLQDTTGQSWKWTPQLCGDPDSHHVGFLWNTNRVLLSNIQSLWPFNVKATSARTACEGGLRPGHYAYIQSQDPGGVDFHLIGLHLKSGPTVFALGDRQKALNRIDHTVAPMLAQDQDVVIVGDFNTMGAGDHASRKSELKYIRRMVGKEQPGFQDFPIAPQCTHYFRGEGGWLDHILVSHGMKEVTATSAQVSGYCAAARCQKFQGEYPAAYRHLSDHCPVILEISNRDDD